MKPKPLGVHVYVGDGISDGNGNDRCLYCRLGLTQGRGKDAHTLPMQSELARAITARIVGEGEAR